MFKKPAEKKIKVTLLNSKDNKRCATKVVQLPHEGDLIWVNSTCFLVQKVVHLQTVMCKKHRLYDPQIWVTPVSEHFMTHYNANKHCWNKDESLENFVKVQPRCDEPCCGDGECGGK